MPVLRTFQLLLLAVLAASPLIGCGRRDNLVRDGGPTKLYDQGKKPMDATDYPSAVKSFQALQSRYPFAPETRQAQLDLIYLYYKGGQPEQAVDAAERSSARTRRIRASTTACTCAASSTSTRRPNFLEKFFRVDMSKRPPKDTMKSFSTFEDLVRRFPNSEYVPDARQRMIYLRNRLARFENYVAQYYITRGAYVAAINRSKYALEHYPGAPELEKTMQIMIDRVREARHAGSRDRREARLRGHLGRPAAHAASGQAAPRAAQRHNGTARGASAEPNGRARERELVSRRNRIAPVAAERAIAHAHAGRRLPALVLGALDHLQHAHDRRALEAERRDLRRPSSPSR